MNQKAVTSSQRKAGTGKLGLRLRYHLRGAGSLDLPELGRHHGTDKCDENHSFSDVSFLDVYEQ